MGNNFIIFMFCGCINGPIFRDLDKQLDCEEFNLETPYTFDFTKVITPFTEC